jgi:hypothetical protein
MWNHKIVASGVAIMAVAIAGACADTPPTEPRIGDDSPALFGGATQDPQSYDGTLDAAFVRVAEAVPGFGGFFRDEAGVGYVYMRSDIQTMSNADALRALSGHLQQMGVDAEVAQQLNVLAAQYDFIQLDAMHRRVTNVLSLQGVVYTDADEAINRVAVGVTNPTAAAAVERAIAMLGVPREAVVIRETAPIQLMQTLRDHTRPTAGGLQINYPGHLCTLGFNVRSPEAPNVHGFVTASHCSAVWGGVDNSPYFQPLSTDANSFLGNEVHDVPFFTGGPCPVGRRCRWSDVNGVRYAPGVSNAFARIYRTRDIFSVTIDPVNPMFNIVAELAFPMVGDSLYKIGRTTGWTRAVVSASCVNTNVEGPGFTETFLCQEHAVSSPGGVLPGDSGAPVFFRFPAGFQTVRLMGLLWGATTEGDLWAFSAMNEIRFENPPPPGHTWRTFPPPPAP